MYYKNSKVYKWQVVGPFESVRIAQYTAMWGERSINSSGELKRCIMWSDNMLWLGGHCGLGRLFMSLGIWHLWGSTIFFKALNKGNTCLPSMGSVSYLSINSRSYRKNNVYSFIIYVQTVFFQTNGIIIRNLLPHVTKQVLNDRFTNSGTIENTRVRSQNMNIWKDKCIRYEYNMTIFCVEVYFFVNFVNRLIVFSHGIGRRQNNILLMLFTKLVFFIVPQKIERYFNNAFEYLDDILVQI